jgi:hypothetical protein
MNPEYFHEFRRLQEAGRKQEAKTALDRFLASFEPADDKKQWVHKFLESGSYGHRIRHEIYEHLVFPVLREGYHRREAWSTFWLGKTAQNLYACPALHSQVGFKSEQQLLREAYQIEPNEQIRESLLRSTLNWFGYCQHEWPAGILYGADGASLVECEEILQDIGFARELDVAGANAPFLQQFEHRLNEYKQRLQSTRRDNLPP